MDEVRAQGAIPLISKLSLHHVGHAVADIDRAADTYVRRFGYELCTPVIHDLTQTALVQFLRLKGDNAYLELVAPDGPTSKLTRAVRSGGGLNHLCYSVEDIDAATAELSGSGMIVLCAPVSAVAFSGYRIAWLCGEDPVPVELVERRGAENLKSL